MWGKMDRRKQDKRGAVHACVFLLFLGICGGVFWWTEQKGKDSDLSKKEQEDVTFRTTTASSSTLTTTEDVFITAKEDCPPPLKVLEGGACVDVTTTTTTTIPTTTTVSVPIANKSESGSKLGRFKPEQSLLNLTLDEPHFEPDFNLNFTASAVHLHLVPGL
jgi:hypothetical protein